MRIGKVWNGRILVVAARSGEGPFYPLVRDVLAALVLRAWRAESIPVRSEAVQRKLAERSANPTAPDLLGHQSMPRVLFQGSGRIVFIVPTEIARIRAFIYGRATLRGYITLEP